MLYFPALISPRAPGAAYEGNCDVGQKKFYCREAQNWLKIKMFCWIFVLQTINTKWDERGSVMEDKKKKKDCDYWLLLLSSLFSHDHLRGVCQVYKYGLLMSEFNWLMRVLLLFLGCDLCFFSLDPFLLFLKGGIPFP